MKKYLQLMMTAQLNKAIKLILIVLGFLILSSFIWLRFIRECLPRDIPFNLSLFGCIVILYICFIYLYILKGLIFKTDVNLFVSSIVKTIYKPLLALDEAFKNNSFIKPYYEKFVANFIYKIKTRDFTFYLYSYFVMLIFPRIILIAALSIDILYFHCIAILYKVLLIGLLIFIGKYIKYSFKYVKEQYILYLESMANSILTDMYDPEKYPNDLFEVLNLRKIKDFIDIQTFTLVYDDKEQQEIYQSIPLRSSASLPGIPLNDSDVFLSKENEKKFKEIMDKVIDISVHISKYEIAENYSRYRYIKIGIFSLYLIAWIYILIKSIHTLDIEEIISIIKIKDIIEPFSGLDI